MALIKVRRVALLGAALSAMLGSLLSETNSCVWAQTKTNSKLNASIERLAHKSGGRLGIACLNLDNGWHYDYQGRQYFPMQSVYKLPIAIAVLKEVDQGKWTLDKTFALGPEDLSALFSPLADRLSRDKAPYSMSLHSLLEASIEESDNTACDYLLRLCPPQRVTAILRELGLEGLSVDRAESEIQPEIFGLPALTRSGSLKERRSAWQKAAKSSQGSFARYLKDGRDTSTPLAMVNLLARLHRGELLSAASTRYLLGLMTATKTGAARLKAALPAGASLAHKTGTGPDLGKVNSATNDVGIITNDEHLAIAVFLSGSTLSQAGREAAIAEACRLILAK